MSRNLWGNVSSRLGTPTRLGRLLRGRVTRVRGPDSEMVRTKSQTPKDSRQRLRGPLCSDQDYKGSSHVKRESRRKPEL